MITQGLSQHEISLITKILDEQGVEYQVGSTQGDEHKPKGGRGDASFYFIEIANENFAKLTPTAASKLENLGIFPEMDAPDFSDDPVDPNLPEVDLAAVKKKHKMIERIIIIALLTGLAMFVKKVMESN